MYIYIYIYIFVCVFSFVSLTNRSIVLSRRAASADGEEEKEEERTEEGTNILASDGAVGCRYSCKGELVAWEVALRVTIEKR